MCCKSVCVCVCVCVFVCVCVCVFVCGGFAESLSPPSAVAALREEIIIQENLKTLCCPPFIQLYTLHSLLSVPFLWPFLFFSTESFSLFLSFIVHLISCHVKISSAVLLVVIVAYHQVYKIFRVLARSSDSGHVTLTWVIFDRTKTKLTFTLTEINQSFTWTWYLLLKIYKDIKIYKMYLCCKSC